MQKKWFLLFLGLLLLLGCTQEQQQTQALEPDTNQNQAADQNTSQGQENQSDANQSAAPSRTQECKELDTAGERDECIQDLALEEMILEYCMELEKFSQDFCIKEVVLLTGIENDCALIKTNFLANECYYQLAVDKSDKTICEKISESVELKNECDRQVLLDNNEVNCEESAGIEEKDECYSGEASSRQNPLFCAFVSSTLKDKEYKRDKCLASALDNYNAAGACELFLDKELGKNCFFETAKTLLDETLCEKSGTQEKTDECYDFIARENSDHLLCEKIADKNKKSECVNYIAQNNPAAELCELATKYSAKDECNYSIATDTNNSLYCAKISGGDLKTDCYYNVALASLKTEDCEKILPNEFGLKDECYTSIAFHLLDETICESVHFNENYISCFNGIAITTNKLEVCDNMERFTLLNLGYDPKFACYRDYAIEKSLPEICRLISPVE